ncbi:cell wall-binding repeat-containing protein [Desulfosporosinus shakirovi]|uniref:cell wall-binding repeat-containing protein n=1 Tax=Desulfosporosinus shakirovi TaxID=2885154 RepID=UPI001E400DEC|nr:cell wall-binding repeat-containing protein [Desulfosporosinus sp. SRJS8]MCB8818319.1 cell wall-binding repeat-containing protein [Desulfosporosinus sp. SRJS8]
MKKKITIGGALFGLFALGIFIFFYPKVHAYGINPGASRLSGQNLYQTAKAISEDYNNSTCENVILAYGKDFPDALSASILSKKLNAPILLVDNKFNENTNEALTYISAHLSTTSGTVYIIGGTSAVGKDIEDKLNSSGYNNIKRIGGNDCFDTNLLVVGEANVPKGTPVFVASGNTFPDALSVSSFAGAKSFPTLLVGANYFPDKTKAFIENINPTDIYITGGTSVVSQDIENQLHTLVPGATIKRLAGNDRFDTAGLVAKEFASSPQNIYFADGYGFPDALAGSALAAKSGDPILLIDKKANILPPSITSYLQQLHHSGVRPNVRALGGSSVVPDALIEKAENILDGKPQNYQGVLVDGKKEGQGKYTWANGDVYSGEWKNDKMNGRGVLVYSDGTEYSGTFVDNKREGQGYIKWFNNETYTGEWKNDLMSGEGSYTFKNGDKYLGSWLNNKMNGTGKYIFKNGQSLLGTWIDNKYAN